jgi:hypothetical protein
MNSKQILEIAKALVKKSPDLRLGQAIFIVANKNYPDITNELTGSEFDCFYQDAGVNTFLRELEEMKKIKGYE